MGFAYTSGNDVTRFAKAVRNARSSLKRYARAELRRRDQESLSYLYAYVRTRNTVYRERAHQGRPPPFFPRVERKLRNFARSVKLKRMPLCRQESADSGTAANSRSETRTKLTSVTEIFSETPTRYRATAHWFHFGLQSNTFHG